MRSGDQTRYGVDDGRGGNRGHWRWAVVVAGLLVLGQLMGCRAVANRPETVAAQVTSQLTAALGAGDRAIFDEALPAMPRESRDMLWHNLRQLGDVEFLAASAETWQVAWRVPGERALAWHELRARWDCTSDCRVTELGQQPGSPTPIWLVQPIRMYRGQGVAVIGGDAAAGWLAAAGQARAQLAGAGLGELLHPPEVIVFEVPSGKGELERVLAAPATDFQQTGALTWLADSGRPAARSADPAPPRVVVNPLATGHLDADQRALLLAHESVHAATGWLGAPVAGRRWLSEGLAETVALSLSADEQARSRARLRQLCPIDTTPPEDAWFVDPSRDLASYAWAAWAVGQLTGQQGGVELIKTLWSDPVAQWSGPGVDPELCS